MVPKDQQKTLFLVFNHTFTAAQEQDARSSLGVTREESDLITVSSELADLRNDLNHAGYRPNPGTADSFRKKLLQITSQLGEDELIGGYQRSDLVSGLAV
ncbi:MAG: hypothetical protein AB1512_20235 [Thermodesulfobacteriota bacterium]